MHSIGSELVINNNSIELFTAASSRSFFKAFCLFCIVLSHSSRKRFCKTSTIGVDGLRIKIKCLRITSINFIYLLGVPNTISSENFRVFFERETSRIKTFFLISCTVL